MRRIFFILLILGVWLGAFSQQPDVNTLAEMERIMADPSYNWGRGESASFDEARESARNDLISKLKTVLVNERTLKDEEFSSSTTAVTVGNIENLKELHIAGKGGYTVLMYVSQKDLQNAAQDRMDLISDFVALGQKQEEKLQISEALKYYVWAYRILNVFQDKVRVSTPNGERDALTWLSNHIPAMLSNISINIPEEKIAEDPQEYDRYLVTVEATYDGKPIQMLDISYFNGKENVGPVHIKSGEGVIGFHDLSAIKNISMRILYDFVQEGRNAASTVQAVYAKGFKDLPFKERAVLSVPLKVKKDKTQQTSSVPEYKSLPALPSDVASKADAAPIEKAPRKTIERPFEKDAAQYYQAMVKVEGAIRARDYQSVKDLFTPEGFKVFELMMGSGTVSVTKKDIKYTVQGTGIYLVGKSIPVNVKTGNHISKENIVFRFDSQSGKISSVAYALTERAENDIFREASWSIESRYALMQFMEDYQTAYALKRTDFISDLFSDNAIIITGSMNAKAKKRLYNQNEIKGISIAKQVKYSKFNKETYISRLKEDFRKKSYIQLVFEDTVIERVGNTEGWVDNDIIWVELKQKYYSSNYSDEGYLALQINLKPSGSLINVRTWTPFFVPMNALKTSFPIGG